ncbi:MAG: glycosyltransferase [Anaerolineales bacterium]|nr:glycosyltransferase [Anaerolineales bacterium]
MRIGMLADVYFPHISGITNHIVLAKRYLEEQGHEVFVFTFGDEDYEDDDPNVIKSLGLPLADTGFYINVRYSLKAQRVLRTMDVVHVHHPFLSGRLALRYCPPRNIPVVFTNHTRYDLYAQAYLPALPGGLSEPLLKTYLSSFCGSCDLVIAPSAGVREVLHKLGVITSIEVVPNGVDLSPYSNETVPIDRSEFGFNESDIVLVYTGRLGPEKNLPFLLRAFAGIAKSFEDVGLLIVGDGPEYDNLVDRVQHMGITDRVHFTGQVPYDDLPRYLATADAFVTASVSEVHPLSVIEAQAAGLPVLGIQSPGVSDIVKDGETGIIAQEEDLALFTANMVRLVTEREDLARMSIEARELAQDYAYDRTSRILLNHYQRLIEEVAGRERSPWQKLRVKINDIMT